MGEGRSSPGSELIIRAVTRDDPRPLWVVINAGSSTLAQVLRDYRAGHTEAETAVRQIHVILEVKDLHRIASLYDYRRIVLDVERGGG